MGRLPLYATVVTLTTGRCQANGHAPCRENSALSAESGAAQPDGSRDPRDRLRMTAEHASTV
jgi:hypothetical protein